MSQRAGHSQCHNVHILCVVDSVSCVCLSGPAVVVSSAMTDHWWQSSVEWQAVLASHSLLLPLSLDTCPQSAQLNLHTLTLTTVNCLFCFYKQKMNDGKYTSISFSSLITTAKHPQLNSSTHCYCCFSFISVNVIQLPQSGAILGKICQFERQEIKEIKNIY